LVVGLAGWALYSNGESTQPPTTDVATIAAQSVPIAIRTSEEMVSTLHTEDSATAIGRNVSILATSIALVGPAPRASVPTKRPTTKATPILTNIRTPTSIEKTASKLTRGLLPCYSQRDTPEKGGSVKFSFRILPDGNVDAVQIKETDFQASAVNDCIRKSVAKWSFGEAGQGAGIVNHERTVSFGVRQ
jgi:hypothetical protein